MIHAEKILKAETSLADRRVTKIKRKKLDYCEAWSHSYFNQIVVVFVANFDIYQIAILSAQSFGTLFKNVQYLTLVYKLLVTHYV